MVPPTAIITDWWPPTLLRSRRSRSWSGRTFATLGYIDWFNHRRLHGEITDDNSYVTPAEFEAIYYRQKQPGAEAVSQYPGSYGTPVVPGPVNTGLEDGRSGGFGQSQGIVHVVTSAQISLQWPCGNPGALP
jgi:hypothetical protein